MNYHTQQENIYDEASCAPGSDCGPNYTIFPRMAEDVGSLIDTLDFLWLNLTPQCNLRCVHCYADSNPANVGPPIQLSYGDWWAALVQAAQMGCRKVQFIGGEPTLNRLLIPLIKAAAELKYLHIEVFTNGTRLSEDFLDVVGFYKVALAVSVYGSSTVTHDAVTLSQGSFSKTIDGIRRSLQRGLDVRAAIIEMDHNIHDVQSTKAFLHNDVGVRHVTVHKIQKAGRGEFISSAAATNRLCGQCWRGKLAVHYDGTISPCVFSKSHHLGTLTDGLEAILRSQSLRVFRINSRVNSEGLA